MEKLHEISQRNFLYAHENYDINAGWSIIQWNYMSGIKRYMLVPKNFDKSYVAHHFMYSYKSHDFIPPESSS